MAETQTTEKTAPAEPAMEKAPEVQAAKAPAAVMPATMDKNERLLATIAYLGPLFVLTFVAKPKSEYCTFHARQSMVLFVIGFITLLLLAAVPSIGTLLFLPLVALYVFTMAKAFSGMKWAIPVVSAIASKIPVESFFGSSIKKIEGMTEGGTAEAKSEVHEAPQKPGDSASEKK